MYRSVYQLSMNIGEYIYINDSINILCFDKYIHVSINTFMYRSIYQCINIRYTVYLGLRGGLWVYKKPKKDKTIFKDL